MTTSRGQASGRTALEWLCSQLPYGPEEGQAVGDQSGGVRGGVCW